ncbi:hypothetical protein CMI48_01395 [Candidatus Pacearchaeota archaeon]|jgi:hypothetical protein|nr:hypothetical protein [Candidatus Pacearchaeota archaeon]
MGEDLDFSCPYHRVAFEARRLTSVGRDDFWELFSYDLARYRSLVDRGKIAESLLKKGRECERTGRVYFVG